jgi:putative nucleotidyltransferase with HDIG domain
MNDRPEVTDDGGRERERNAAGRDTVLINTIIALADGIERRDVFKVGHQLRVARLAQAVGRRLGLPAEGDSALWIAARLHDIGIVAVPTEILNRPAALTAAEYALLKTHPQVGYDMLHSAGFDERVAVAILQHHERLDGSGYPGGLRGGEIVQEARLIALADVVEAFCTRRAHRPALGPEAALEEIARQRGRLYDAEAVDACVALFREEGFSFG